MKQETHRIEKDSLGEVLVPTDALYGAQTQRAVDNFSISNMKMPRAFIRALGLVKYACAQVHTNENRLEKNIGEAICESALSVASGQYDKEFPVDVFQTGSGTSTNMNVNEVIAQLSTRRLGQHVHPNDHVNMSQSSNDVIPTVISLSAAMEISEFLLPSLNRLAASIDAKSVEFSDVVKTGRTHLMDALPITIGQELGGWATQIRNNIQRISASLQGLKELAIGGTAVGSGLNAPKDFSNSVCEVLSVVTSLRLEPKKNFFEGLSCQDVSVEMSGQLKTLAVSLMKISNDLRWMNSGPLAGLGEITLPELQPGSSIMPGKVNPVIPEALAQVAAKVIGNDTTITVAGQSGNFQLNVMLPLIGCTLLESISLLSRGSMALATKAIDGITINQHNIEKTLSRNPILITALNEKIGYEKGAQIAKRAYLEKREIIDLALDMTDLDEKTLKELLDPRKLTLSS